LTGDLATVYAACRRFAGEDAQAPGTLKNGVQSIVKRCIFAP
jgi:hypothetical protein